MGRPAEPPVNKQPAGGALPPGVPRCPKWLHPYGRAEWRRVVKLLAPTGKLTEADLAPLASYCQAVAELQLASELLETEGRTFTTEKGYVGQHPAIAMQRSAWAAIRSFSALFGLDPQSRAKLGAPAKAEGRPGVQARKRG